jgi:hypothetical protein
MIYAIRQLKKIQSSITDYSDKQIQWGFPYTFRILIRELEQSYIFHKTIKARTGNKSPASKNHIPRRVKLFLLLGMINNPLMEMMMSARQNMSENHSHHFPGL